MKWLIELDNVLQHIMVKCNYGANHSELRNIAKEMNEDFLQFCLFSETRFYQYAQRTYNNFAKMFHILFEKLLRDTSKDARKQMKTFKTFLFKQNLSETWCSCRIFLI